MPPINEILYRFTGDEEDARDAMERLATELEAFARIHAEAEVEVDTTEARVRIDEIKVALDRLDATNADPRIAVDIAAAMAQLRTVEAQMDAMDGREIDIEVDLDRSLEDRLLGLTRTVTQLTSASAAFDDQGKSFVARLADMAVHVGPFTTQLRVAIPLAAGLASVIVSLGGALAALASSFGAAIAGLGALAVAFGGALLPAIGLAVTAVKRFQQQSEQAGTPAHALAEAFSAVADAAKALLPAADPVLRALAEGVRALVPLIRTIRPAFEDFGRAAGQAIGIVAKAISDPVIAKGIADLIRMAGDVFPPLADAATSLFRIFLNIARAAMPLLVAALEDVAEWLGNVADSTDDIGRLRDGISVLVDHTRAWLGLLREVSRVFLSFAEAALPAGKEFVEFLTEGAQGIADWIQSAEGTARIQTFFENVMPLARELVEFIAKLVLAFIQFGEVAAPIVQPIVAGFNAVLDVINFILDKLAQLPAPLRAVAAIAGVMLLPFEKLRFLFTGLQIAFGALRDVIVAGFNAIKGVADAVWNGIEAGANAVLGAVKAALSATVSAVKTAWDTAKSVTTDVWNAIRDVTRAVWNAIRDVVRSVVNAIRDSVRSAFNAARDVARAVWNAIKDVITNAIRAARDVVRDVVNSIKDVVQNAFQAAREFAQNIWGNIKDVISNAIRAAADIVRNAAGNIKDALVEAARAAIDGVGNALGQLASVFSRAINTALNFLGGIVSSFFSAGVAIIRGMIDGIVSMAEEVVGAVKDVIDGALSVLPGSEPKDKSSPATHLDRRGAAFVENIIGGIRARSGQIARAMAGAIGDLDVPLNAALSVPGTAGGGGNIHNEFNVTAPAGLTPDPRAAVAQMAAELRARGGIPV